MVRAPWVLGAKKRPGSRIKEFTPRCICRPPDLKRIFTSPAFYSANIVTMVACFAFYVQLTFLPQYMEYQMGTPLQTSGVLSVIPYILQIAGKLISGVLADTMISKWDVDVPLTRKLMTVISTWIPAAALFLVCPPCPLGNRGVFLVCPPCSRALSECTIISNVYIETNLRLINQSS